MRVRSAWVIVKGGQVVGEGCNRVTATHDPTAHAEIVAIRDACRRLSTFDLSGAEIYTSCEPCPMCLAAIYWARLERIHFANTKEDAAAIDFDDHFIYDEIGRDPADRARSQSRAFSAAGGTDDRHLSALLAPTIIDCREPRGESRVHLLSKLG